MNVSILAIYHHKPYIYKFETTLQLFDDRHHNYITLYNIITKFEQATCIP